MTKRNNIQFGGAYWRRYSNYEDPAYSIEVTSGNPEMGTAGFVKKETFSASTEETAQQFHDRGSGRYPAGTKFKVSATAFPGYEFVQWQSSLPDINGTSQNPLEITLTKNTVISARFQRSGNPGGNPPGNDVCTVKVSWPHVMGQVSNPNLVPDTASRDTSILTAHVGDTVKLTAAPNSGYHFVRWTGGPQNGTETNREYTFQVNGSYNIKAVFEADGGVNPPDDGGENPPYNGGDTPSFNSGGIADKVKAFVREWWWALLIVAYLIYKERKGGSK